MKILVTGSTGFIASHLLPVLQQKHWEIIAQVRKIPANLPIVCQTVTVENINENTNWKEALKEVDIVIHLAARAHILQDKSLYPEQEFLRINTLATANLVQQSIAAGVKQFIFLSSIGAMTTISHKILQETSPCQPDTAYGQSKLKAEEAIVSKSQNSSMHWTILRPTLVYGAGNPGNMKRLIELVAKKIPLPLGAIHNRRSFLYVGNLVDAIATCINNPQAFRQTFIISDGEDISTTELIRLIATTTNQPCYLLPIPIKLLKILSLNSESIHRLIGSLFVDSSHIQNTLVWQPPFTVIEGIKLTCRKSK